MHLRDSEKDRPNLGIFQKNNKMQTKMMDILISRDYQDRTGQLIQTMANLLKGLEEGLVALIMKLGELRQIM